MNKKPLILGGIVIVAALAAAAWYFNRSARGRHRASCSTATSTMRQVSLAFNGSERIGELDVRGRRPRQGRPGARRARHPHAEAARGAGPGADRRAGAGPAAPEDRQPPRRSGAGPRAAWPPPRPMPTWPRSSWSACRASARPPPAAPSASRTSTAPWPAARSRRRSWRTRARPSSWSVTGPRKEDIAQAQAQLEAARAELALLNRQLEEAELQAAHRRRGARPPDGARRHGLAAAPGLHARDHRSEMGARLRVRGRPRPRAGPAGRHA